MSHMHYSLILGKKMYITITVTITYNQKDKISFQKHWLLNVAIAVTNFANLIYKIDHFNV